MAAPQPPCRCVLLWFLQLLTSRHTQAAGLPSPMPAWAAQVRALRGVEQAAPQPVTVTATLEAEAQ